MAVGTSRKISAASARAHTRRNKQTSSSKLPSGIFGKILAVLSVGILAWAYRAMQPPPPKICGSSDGPPVTAERIKLRDGRYLAYKEHGMSKDIAKHKIIYIHPFDGTRHDAVLPMNVSPELIEEFGVYVVTFDRPGYGESDPHPKRTVETLALDIEELADQLGLGSKFYVVGLSMGGQVTWGCLKYIPHRLAGLTLLTPVINYWWPGFPANLSTEAYNQQLLQDQWALRVAHYAPWLIDWWMTQSLFPASSVASRSSEIFSAQDKELLPRMLRMKKHSEQARQQGVHESIIRDVKVAFGSWEFDPMDLENPFPNNEGSVHLWQGDKDLIVPVQLQRYIAQQLPWIHYHELPQAGHLFVHADGVGDDIIKAMLTKET